MGRKRERVFRNARKETSAPLPKSPVDWRRHLFLMLGVWGLALAAYSNSFHGALASDSGTIVRDDPRIRAAAPPNLDAIWSTGYWYDNEDPTLFRPMTTISYLVNYAVLGDGPAPAGYHRLNFLLHAINAALLYALGLIVFGNAFRSAALAALWAVHPVLTESVTNIVGRADLLAGFGVLAGLICHAKAVSSSGSRRYRWLAGLGLASAIGIFSKEGAVVLVALIPAYDLAFRKSLRASMPSYAVAILPVAVFLFRRWQVLANLPFIPIAFLRNPLAGMSFWKAKLTAIQVIGRYMALVVWPRTLSFDYSYNQIPLFQGGFHAWGDWAAVLALGVTAALAVFTAVSYRRRPPVFFFGLFFFIALAPVCNLFLTIRTIMAERFLYLPAIGLMGCAVWAVFTAMERWSGRAPGGAVKPAWIVALIGGLVFLALVARTHTRNLDWENDRALLTSAAAAAPDSYKPHMALAHILFTDAKDVDAAIREGERGFDIIQALPLDKQGDVEPYMDLGALYRVKGDLIGEGPGTSAGIGRSRYLKSLEVLKQGEEVDRALAARARSYAEANGKPAAPWGIYRLYEELGVTYLRLNEPKEAIQAVEYAFVLQPDADSMEMLSEAYMALNDRDDAAMALVGGLLLQPDQKRFASELAELYGSDTSGCALIRNGGAGSLNPDCPVVHRHLCGGSQRLRDLLDSGGQHLRAGQVRDLAAQMFGCPAQ